MTADPQTVQQRLREESRVAREAKWPDATLGLAMRMLADLCDEAADLLDTAEKRADEAERCEECGSVLVKVCAVRRIDAGKEYDALHATITELKRERDNLQSWLVGADTKARQQAERLVAAERTWAEREPDFLYALRVLGKAHNAGSGTQESDAVGRLNNIWLVLRAAFRSSVSEPQPSGKEAK